MAATVHGECDARFLAGGGMDEDRRIGDVGNRANRRLELVRVSEAAWTRTAASVTWGIARTVASSSCA